MLSLGNSKASETNKNFLQRFVQLYGQGKKCKQMKKLLMYMTGISLMITGCKKSADRLAISDSIEGTWELRKTSAAMMPGAVIHEPGSGNKLKFTGNKFEMYVKGQLTESGTYQIIPDATVEENVCLVFADGQFENRIVYNVINNNAKIFFQITDNKLMFQSGCYALDGGHSEVYERIELGAGRN